MTEAEFRKHLDAAEKSPKQIAAAVSGSPDKTLRYKPAPDKWCILEIVAHLADFETLYVRICARVGFALLTEPAPHAEIAAAHQPRGSGNNGVPPCTSEECDRRGVR